MKNSELIFIPNSVPSSKNGRVWTGRFFIESKAVRNYKKDTKDVWERNTKLFKKLTNKVELPLLVGFHFVRGSKHKYDFVNPLQTVQDLMSEYGWIEDDNTDVLIPFPLLIDGAYSSYSKENPGVFISVITK